VSLSPFVAAGDQGLRQNSTAPVFAVDCPASFMHETETPDNPSEPAAPKPPAAHPYAVFRNADFRRYISARFIAATGMQMLVVAIDWELYERTGSALALGFVGLALMIPMIL